MQPSTEAHRPFYRERFEIGPDRQAAPVLLDALQPDEASRLGSAFASMEPWRSYRLSAADLATFFARREEGVVRHAIRSDGELAGVVIVRPAWLHGPYLWFVGLTAAYQSRGIGGCVLTWLEAEARSAGARNLWLCVSEINVRARARYEREGFSLAGDLEGLTADHMNEHLMRKQLRPIT